MAYLDLDEVERVPELRKLTRARKLARFRASDHMIGWDGPLDSVVRDLVARETGSRPAGPIRLLTQLRHFGYYFSPLNLYYCFDPAGEQVETIVGEVNNTPWREQHHYVLCGKNRVGDHDELAFVHPKNFHVSPFLEMDYEYHWQLSVPGDQLRVRLENRRSSVRTFDASMLLSRRDFSRWQLNKMLARYPIMTAAIVAAIHWQALRLWWKKCPVYSHPSKQQNLSNSGA
jgi:DUF1365 family protein